MKSSAKTDALAAAVISTILACLPAVANLDWTSSAGVLAGIAAVLGIVAKRLQGWQKHEARQAGPATVRISGSASALADTISGELGSDEDGDDALPAELDGRPAHDPATIPPDEGDAGPEATT